MELDQIRGLIDSGWHHEALHELCDYLEQLEQRIRKPAEDDFRTAATSREVCVCAYKPYPHPRLPLHPAVPKA